METVAAVLLGLIVGVCFAGVVSRDFDDNLLQRFGLGLLGVAALARLLLTVQREYASPDSVLLYSALLIYAWGTARKVRKYRRPARPLRTVRVDREEHY